VHDQRLKFAFVWPTVQEKKRGLSEEDFQIGESLDKKDINLW
jgi:hypothetical protein